MCRSDKFKRIRDNYEKVSSASYARQLKKEEASLNKLKEEGKLKEAEYYTKLQELQERYERQLDDLETYIDRFSRIDLSELSSVEQEIIELVQAGRIDEAIAKYEEQNYIDKYAKEVAEIKEVATAIDQLEYLKISKEQSRDSILAAIDRQIEVLKLAGGKENMDKIQRLLKEIVDLEPNDKSNLWKYISFLDNQSLSNEMRPAIDRYLTLDLLQEEKIEAYRLMIKTLLNLAEFEQAQQYVADLNSLLTSIVNENTSSIDDIALIGKSYFTIGGLYMECNHPELAEPYFKKGLDLLPEPSQVADSFLLKLWLDYMVAMGIIRNEQKNTEFLDSHIDKLLSVANELQNHYLSEENSDILKTLTDMGQLLELNRHFEEAENLYNFTEDKYLKLIDNNPTRINPRIANLYSSKGILMQKWGRYEESEKAYQEAVKYYKASMEKSPRKFTMSIRTIYNNLSLMYLKMGEPQKALEMAKESYDIALKYYEDNPFYYSTSYRKSCISLARTYEELGEYTEAEKLYIIAQEINDRTLSERGPSFTESHWINSIDLALFYVQREDYKNAIPRLKVLIESGKNFITPEHRLYTPLQSWLYFLGKAYNSTGEYDEAIVVLSDFINNNPDKFTGYMELARSEANLNHWKEARRNLDRALELNPKALDNLEKDDILLRIPN